MNNIISQISVGGKSVVNINGQELSGNNIIVSGDGTVTVDGVTVESPSNIQIDITVKGEVETLEVSNCNMLTVQGAAGSVTVDQGSVECKKVHGDVKVDQGKVKCGDVTGNVNVDQGKADVLTVFGNTNVNMGSINYNRRN